MTSKHQPDAAILKRNLELPFSPECGTFLRAVEVSGERNASYSAEIYHDPPRLKGVAAQHRFFFHRCLFFFWALISRVSFARPFPTLGLPSIIHNLQLLPLSHSATYLQTIIFLFWNVWKRACPAATSWYGCWESRFHIFAQNIFSCLTLIKQRNRSQLLKWFYKFCSGRVWCFWRVLSSLIRLQRNRKSIGHIRVLC